MMKSKRYIVWAAALMVLLSLGVQTAFAATTKRIIMPTEYEDICKQDLPYTWMTKNCTKAGTYTDSIKTTDKRTGIPAAQKVDTMRVYKLVLTTHEYEIENRTVYLCDDCSFIYKGKKYTKPTIFYDTIPVAGTCDSVICFTIRRADGWHYFDTAHSCSGDTYRWHSQTLTEHGDYTAEYTTTRGFDSIYHLHLIVHDPVHVYDTVTICRNEAPYRWQGNAYNTNGDYTRSWRTRYRCDSIMHLNLTILPVPKPDTVITYFCQSEGIISHGVKVMNDTTFNDTISAVNGCDSVIVTHLIPHPTYLIEEVKQHFAGQPVSWRGKTFLTDTIYQDSLTTVHFGCDSIYQLRVITKYEVYQHVNRCYDGNETTMHGGTVVTDNITFHDTLLTVKGADSIVHTTYTFSHSFYNLDTVRICENTELPWIGHLDPDPLRPHEIDPVTGEELPNYIMLHATADAPGYFYDNFHLDNGCDSVYEMVVLAHKAYEHDTLVIWCNDSLDAFGPFEWTDIYGNKQYWRQHDVDTFLYTTRATTQEDVTIYNPTTRAWDISGGCDSIERIHLIVTSSCSPLERIPMCEGGSVTVDGKVYTEPGRYFNTMPSSPEKNVPDSTHTFEIYTVYATETQTEIVVKESELPYQWHDQWLRAAGDYEYHMQTQYKCDSLIKLHFIVIPSVYSEVVTYNYCASANTEIHLPSGRVVTPTSIEGDYNDTLPYNAHYTTYEGVPSIWTGDSILRIHIVGHESYYYSDTIVIPTGGKYIWHRNGQPIELTEQNIYWDSCKTVVWGCDSIYRLDLRVAEDWYIRETKEVCENDLPYQWRGRDCYDAKIYADKLIGVHGTDSVYELELIIHPSYQKDTIDINICQETEYSINGVEIPIYAGVRDYYFHDTLKTTYTGCDSIIVYHIRRTSKTIIDQGVDYTKEGTPYLWEPITGHPITCVELGSYYDTIRSVITGCDSIIYTFELRYDRPFFEPTVAEICQSDGYYEWRGRRFYKDTVVADTFHTFTRLQLDSIYQLELTVFPTYFLSETKFICAGEGVNFAGKYITEPGIYYDTAQTVIKGCDSINQLILNPAPHYFFPETITYVYDTELPITWNGHVDQNGDPRLLPGEGVYYDSLTTQVGHPCDSVYKVQVIKKQSYEFVKDTSICEGEYYEFFGTKYYDSGTYIQPYKTKYGVDSIYTLHLTVNPIKVTRIPVFLCVGSGYPFLDTVLTEPTIYRDTLVNENTLCDSIFEIIVNWYDNSETVVNHKLCEGDKVVIGDQDITHSGVYYETLQSSISGCDSVVKHIVTVGKPYYHEESHVLRKGETFNWHHCGVPVTVSAAGEYWDSCKTILGCDSIMKLTIAYVKDVVFPTRYDTVCYTDLPYIWDTYPISKAISQAGLHYDTCKGNGADTIRSLHLTIIPTVRTSETLEFCSGESYRISGVRYTEDAVVVDTLTGPQGCDSIVTYHLKFYPRYEQTKTVKLTAAQPYIDIHGALNIIGGDTTIRTTGIYYFRYQSIHGCDSLLTLIVDECKGTKLKVIPYNMCQGDALTVNGQRITQSGSYDFFFDAEDGCDSIVRYVVKVNPSYEFTTPATMCKNSSFTWRNKVYTQQGTYYDSLETKLGCDSVYILKLTYTRTDLLDTVVSWCRSNLPYRYKGVDYFEEHVFYDTLPKNVEGCDSVLRWTYKINDHCSDYAQFHLCTGDYKEIDGEIVHQAGSYVHHHLTADGQDSLFRFTVHDVPVFEDTVKMSGCDSLEFDGKWYYARGMGREHFVVDLPYTSRYGCDSIIHLDLTLHMSSPTHEYSRTIADFDSVPFGPYYHNTQGDHVMHYTNVHGCDSTEILHLTVLETEYQQIVHYEICAGDNRGVEVFGKLYMPDQEYRYIVDTTWIAGRPIIRTADITVRKPFTLTHFDAHEDQLICSDFETTFQVQFATADPLQLPDYYAVDFLTGDFEAHPMHQEAAVNGKTTLDIQMNGQGKYITPGKYRYRIKFWSRNCEFNDTTLDGSLLVRYPADVMEAAWNDAIMLVNEQYNGGGWVFRPPYTWSVVSAEGTDKTALVVKDATQPYLYSDALEEGDRISAILYREGYDQAMPSCEFIFKPKLAVTDYPILIYPTAVQKNMPVTVKASRKGDFRLFNQMGRIYTNGHLNEGETLVTMPAQSGCYLMIVEDKDGNRKVQKIIVY